MGSWPWQRVFAIIIVPICFHTMALYTSSFPGPQWPCPCANHNLARTSHWSTSHITHSQTQFWVGSETVYSVVCYSYCICNAFIVKYYIYRSSFMFGYPNGYPNGYSNSTPSIRSHYGTQQVHLYVMFYIFTCLSFIFYFLNLFIFIYIFIVLFLQ